MEELIARGGTAGLIAALLLGIGFLARFAMRAYDDLRADRDAWRVQAQAAVKGFEDVIRENGAMADGLRKLTEAVQSRNRIEESRANGETRRVRKQGT